jgi:hypothetical protein
MDGYQMIHRVGRYTWWWGVCVECLIGKQKSRCMRNECQFTVTAFTLIHSHVYLGALSSFELFRRHSRLTPGHTRTGEGDPSPDYQPDPASIT